MYALLDGPEPDRSLDMLAADLRFSIVFSHGPGDAREFSGGREQFDAYMAQRGAPSWTHHVLAHSSEGAWRSPSARRGRTACRSRPSSQPSGSTRRG
jgi:hypothetical protein